jgi:ATP-binding cassette subfamily C protein CydD
LREAKAARWFFAGVVAFALLGTIGTITFALQLTLLVVSPERANLALAFGAAALKALTIIGQEWFSSVAATRVKAQLREKLLQKVIAADRDWLAEQSSSELNLLLTSGLDSLDAYFAKFLPQIVYTALAAPIYVWVIFSQDALSGITILVTMPLIPLFMTFIGWATSKVQTRQLDSLTSLSQHFVDALRGLTTLRVFGRAEAQVSLMLENSEKHRKRTMQVLSISFLSGFALELIASLAVALVAVSIGLRLIDGSISLAAGLLVLVLAPDAYLPLRTIGANFHASTDGVTAIQRVFKLINSKPVGRAIKPLRIKPKAGKLLVVTGASGAGKSTALRELVNSSAAWMAQGEVLFDGSILSNIVGPGAFDKKAFDRSVELAAIDDFDFETRVSQNFSSLSGGQAQRVALARAFYRLLTAGCKMLLLDEPISSLDSKRAKQVCQSLKLFAAQGVAVVAVSHQRALISIADEIIEVAR